MRFFGKKNLEAPRNGGTAPAKIEYAVGALVEQLVLLEASPWDSMVLVLEMADGVMRVASMDVALNPNEDELPEYLMDDHAFRTGIVSDACARLAKVLLRDEKWILEGVECNRLGHSFSLLVKGKKKEKEFPDIPMEGMLFTPNTSAELHMLAPSIKSANHKLKALIGNHRDKEWDSKETPHQIRFTISDTTSLTVPAAILGSYSSTLHSWCWAWANSSFSPYATTTIGDYREQLLNSADKSLYLRGGFPATLPFCWTIAHLAGQGLGNHPVFAWPVQEGRVHLFFALDIGATGFKTGA